MDVIDLIAERIIKSLVAKYYPQLPKTTPLDTQDLVNEGWLAYSKMLKDGNFRPDKGSIHSLIYTVVERRFISLLRYYNRLKNVQIIFSSKLASIEAEKQIDPRQDHEKRRQLLVDVNNLADISPGLALVIIAGCSESLLRFIRSFNRIEAKRRGWSPLNMKIRLTKRIIKLFFRIDPSNGLNHNLERRNNMTTVTANGNPETVEIDLRDLKVNFGTREFLENLAELLQIELEENLSDMEVVEMIYATGDSVDDKEWKKLPKPVVDWINKINSAKITILKSMGYKSDKVLDQEEPTDELDTMTLPELKPIAKGLKITITGKKRAVLIEEIRAARQEPEVEEEVEEEVEVEPEVEEEVEVEPEAEVETELDSGVQEVLDSIQETLSELNKAIETITNPTAAETDDEGEVNEIMEEIKDTLGDLSSNIDSLGEALEAEADELEAEAEEIEAERVIVTEKPMPVVPPNNKKELAEMKKRAKAKVEEKASTKQTKVIGDRAYKPNTTAWVTSQIVKEAGKDGITKDKAIKEFIKRIKKMKLESVNPTQRCSMVLGEMVLHKGLAKMKEGKYYPTQKLMKSK
jgi:uncharacterized protein YoxC